MSVAPLTTPPPAVPYQEPTHRFGRALDDRLPFSRAPQPAPAPDGITTASVNGEPGGDDNDLTFGDFLDMVNPLQHLPVISTLYRELTGDEIGPAAKVVGGGLFGGVIGAAASLLDVAIEEFSGDDMGGHIMTALFGDDDMPEAPGGQMLAAAPGGAAPAALPAPVPAALAAADSVTTAAVTARTQELFDSPAVPNLSAGEFEALMQRFGTTPATGTTSGAGLAYTTPAPRGQLVDSTL